MSQDPSMGDPTPQGYGGPTPPGEGQQPASAAGLGVRIGARLLDTLLVGVPVVIVLALIGLGTAGFGVRGWASNAILALLWFGYFVWFESNQGATVGKKLLTMQVIATDGRYPSMAVAAKRNVWMLFGLIPFVGGLLSLIAVVVIIVTISSSSDDRGYHDTFAGTAVLR